MREEDEGEGFRTQCPCIIHELYNIIPLYRLDIIDTTIPDDWEDTAIDNVKLVV